MNLATVEEGGRLAQVGDKSQKWMVQKCEDTVNVLWFESYNRGYHAYVDLWGPIVGDDFLKSRKELENIDNEYMSWLSYSSIKTVVTQLNT